MIVPENAYKRRSEVGLDSLAEYLKNYELSLDIEKVKKRMDVFDSERNRKQRMLTNAITNAGIRER
jgi:predicted nucleotidyltransferase